MRGSKDPKAREDAWGSVLKRGEFCGKGMIAECGRRAVKVLDGRPRDTKRAPGPEVATGSGIGRGQAMASFVV